MENTNDIKRWAQTFTSEEISPHSLSLQAQPLDPELFPQEVIAATLANLFHFLTRNENGLCDQILYPVIQQLFRSYPYAQQRLVENILNTVSKRQLESISLQLLNISTLLDEQAQTWLVQQTLRIMFYRQWSDEHVRHTLKYLSKGLALDPQRIQAIIGDMQNEC
jgi:hypothetical protein